MNQILKQCDGKINQHGWCDKCFQPAHTTSNQCNRYLPLEQLQQPVVMQGLLKQSDVSAAAKKHWRDASGLYEQEEMVQDSFEAGVWWACTQLSSSPTVGKAGGVKGVSVEKNCPK